MLESMVVGTTVGMNTDREMPPTGLPIGYEDLQTLAISSWNRDLTELEPEV